VQLFVRWKFVRLRLLETPSKRCIHSSRISGPGGFELVNAPVKMTAAVGTITATGTYHRRDVTQEITAATREERATLVPEGWTMLHVQSV
jgi:hypothetical protein